MKTITTLTTVVLSALFLVPFAGADNNSKPTVSGTINNKTQVVKYTYKDGNSRSVKVRINKNSSKTANNSFCDKKAIPTCSFVFGKNKNPKLTKKQVNFIKKGLRFQVIVGKKPGVVSIAPTYFFSCSTGLSSSGKFSCQLIGAPV